MSFSALIPADQLQSANAALESQGYGPSNFSVPVFTGTRPTHVTLHSWTDAAFQAAVEALPNVTVSTIAGEPADRVADALSAINGQWGGNAPPLEGQVTPGLYREGDELWTVIQPFDRNVRTGPLHTYPALILRAREPGVATPWAQPRFAEEAYTDNDPFTGEPERVWREIDGEVRYFKTGIDNNTTIPGTPESGPPFNYWIETDADGNEITPPEPSGWVDSGATTAGPSGAGTMGVSDDSPFSANQRIRVDQNDSLVTTVTGIHSNNLLLINPHITVGSGQMIEIEQ